MTKERTWRAGALFYKHVGSLAEAERLVGRAHWIARAGGNTPAAEYCPGRNAVAFPAIDGTTGVALIGKAALSELLVPLQAIRRSGFPDLPVHDPLAKVMPRLAADAPQWLTGRVAHLADMITDTGGVVHGDFHCGQLIRDGTGLVWVIDLEDMARGPVEADLGNFVAHLATRAETRQADLAEGVRFWAERVLDAWDRLGETSDPALFWRYVDIALTRRALKLRDERGEPGTLALLRHLPLFS
ncbi:MAG: phosphotransferase [Minwuiales bacterium]|nr:phosphotransferase [Minwuiales bacterium]